MRTRQRNDTSNKKKRAKRPKKEPKEVTKGIYKGIEYDSLGELAILQWLYELKNMGYIKTIKRAESYLLCDTLTNNYAQQRKGVTSKPMEQNLLRGHSYTPEFEVIWNKNQSKPFVWEMGTRIKFDKTLIGQFIAGKHETMHEICTIIEVKPSFDQNNMERLFKLNQKWMWDKHKIFVNLIKVNELFPITFTPKDFLTTPSGKKRLLKWPYRSASQYINSLKST